jgi:hypothetical protein
MAIPRGNAAFLVFSGFNQRAVVAFLRVLERHGIDYGIAAAGDGDSILLSDYRQRVVDVRSSLALRLDSIRETVFKARESLAGRELILAPSTEALNRFCLANRRELESIGLRIPLVERGLYERISDKHPFGDLCRSHGIRVPAEVGSAESAPLPFVAKPMNYDGATGLRPVIVHSEGDRQSFLAGCDVAAYYFQEFVTGRSLYLLLYIANNGRVAAFSQENLIQQPGGKSIVAAVAADFHRASESRRYIDMLRGVGFHGLVMVEVRQRDSDYFMIEANPRFWGPSQLFVDAMEEDLFDAFLADLGFESAAAPKQVRNDRYFWHGGLLEARRGGGEAVFHRYTAGQLLCDMPDWLAADIYRRPDTMGIYSAEADIAKS